jgi:pimeloyl-ACP methyl ester carboxylesterase
VSGEGPPVVLIHAFGETLERWHSAGVVERLSPEFQVITFDVRGHGRSGKPTGPESYGTALAADVVRLIEHIGAPKAHVVGYSMGALIALDVATLHPDRALSIVLGGAGVIPQEYLADFAQRADALEREGIPMQDRESAVAQATLLRSLRTVSESDVRRITLPVAALIGAHDSFMPDVDRLKRLLPGVEVVVIPDANHLFAVDHPKFAEGLLAFLRRQPKPTGR